MSLLPMSLLPALLVSFLGATCAQYTEVPGIPYEEHLKTFGMSSDASKVMFFNNEDDQIQIVTNYDWDNFVSVSVDDTGSFVHLMERCMLSQCHQMAAKRAQWRMMDMSGSAQMVE